VNQRGTPSWLAEIRAYWAKLTQQVIDETGSPSEENTTQGRHAPGVKGTEGKEKAIPCPQPSPATEETVANG